jgi:uncharacterized membrane protein
MVVGRARRVVLGVAATGLSAAGKGSDGIRRERALILVTLVFAVAGAAIASYLVYENLQNRTGVCTITHGCATVQKSSYGKILGVPVSVPGLALYVTLGAAAVAWLTNLRGLRDTVAVLACYLALFGFLFSGYLTYVEGFVLDAWCIYCIGSASLMTLLFLAWATEVALVVRRRRRAG